MPESRFSRLPNRIVVPLANHRRRMTKGEAFVSFVAAYILIALATIVICLIGKFGGN